MSTINDFKTVSLSQAIRIYSKTSVKDICEIREWKPGAPKVSAFAVEKINDLINSPLDRPSLSAGRPLKRSRDWYRLGEHPWNTTRHMTLHLLQQGSTTWPVNITF